MTQAIVKVEGLAELRRAFKRTEDEMSPVITKKLQVIVKEVAALARHKAEEQGFAAPGRSGRGTGELLRKIKTSVRLREGLVKETALRGSFAYPKVYEYGHGGSRAFMHPAAHESAPMVHRELTQLLEDVVGRNFHH